MRFSPICFILLIAFFIGHSAVLIGTTEDGRKVILKEDGSWKFATPGDMTAIESMQSKNADNYTANKHDGETGGARVQMKSQVTDEPERARFLDVVGGDQAFDIRNARWGMDKQEVKRSERLQLIQETQTTLEYKFKLIGIESKIVYTFTMEKAGKNRLVGAQYLIEQDDVNPARFFDDYKSLKTYLQKLYGFPVSDENKWTNDIYKADEKNRGFAISLGFLTCKAMWKNARTKTVLLLSGGNHILSANIEYFAVQK